MQPLKIETHKISPVCLSIVVGFQSVRLPLASTPPILHSIFLTFSTPFWLAFGWVVMVAARQEFIFYSDRQLRMNFLGIFLLIIKVDKHFKVTYSYFLVLDSFKIVHHPELHQPYIILTCRGSCCDILEAFAPLRPTLRSTLLLGFDKAVVLLFMDLDSLSNKITSQCQIRQLLQLLQLRQLQIVLIHIKFGEHEHFSSFSDNITSHIYSEH